MIDCNPTRYKPHSVGSLIALCKSFISLFSILIFCLALGACNGGILGTGDGDDPKLVPGEEGNDIQGGPEAMPPEVDGVTDNSPDDLDISFINNQVTAAGNNALIRVVHAATDEQSEALVITDELEAVTPFIDLPGLSHADGYSNQLAIDSSVEHDFDFFWSEDFRADTPTKFAGLNPLLVSNNTSSTIIVRGTDNTANQTPFELLVLSNRTATGNGNGYIRVVHAASYFSAKGAMDIHLLSSGETLDASSPTFDQPLVYTDNPDTAKVEPNSGYIELIPGDYTLTTTSIGGATVLIPQSLPFQLNAGEVLTLVLRDNTSVAAGDAAELLIITDSNIN